ncbi:MAG: Hsp33 family molecular chaperone HslO, partial [Clostridia bacterium]|nr:Hsp33 family molecular chaperone HslO [Clostridia bacterium]
KEIRPITAMLSQGMTPAEICRAALPGFHIETLGEYETEYRCNCSKRRVERALISAGRKSLEEMAQDPQTEVQCHFCNKKYVFAPEDIRRLISAAQ